MLIERKAIIQAGTGIAQEGTVNLSSVSMKMNVLEVLTSKIWSSDADRCTCLEADSFVPDLHSARTFPTLCFGL